MSDRQATRRIAARLMGLGRLPADAVAPSATAVHEVLADTLEIPCSSRTRRAWVRCAEARLGELRSEALVRA